MEGDLDAQGGGGPAKRLRRDDPEGPAPSYPRGSIMRVKVHDFMTYTGTVVITPGPRLNLVLGPNGTGKSSLVCALCIGLGGSPKLLGRADNLKDFVRRGCQEAWIEITLSGGPGRSKIVVRREIKQQPRDDNSTGYTSKWRLDGLEAPQAEVQELIRELNIQFDNLCQFLPQDRVVSFARMDAYELLAATQKAIGDSTLYDQHQDLLQRRDEVRALDTSLAAKLRQLEKVEAENRQLERDADRFRRRQQLTKQLDDIHTKEVWATVATKETQVASDERALGLAQTLLQRHTDEVADDAGPLKDAKLRAKELQQQLSRLGAPFTPTQANRLSRLQSAVKSALEEVTAITERIQALDQKHDEWRSQIAGLQREVESKQKELAALPPAPDHGSAIEKLGKEVAALSQKRAPLDADIRSIEDRKTFLTNQALNIKQHIAQLDSLKHRRLQVLCNYQPQLRDMHQWLEDEKRAGVFQGPVYGPLGLDITVQDHLRYAKPVEAAVHSMLHDFAVTCRADEERVSAKLKALGLRSRVHAHTKPLDAPYPALVGPASQYARYGVKASLADLVQAPPLVMQVLTNGPPALACAFVMDRDDQIDALFTETNVRTVYTQDHEHRAIKAAYGQGRQDNARESKLLYPARFLGGALTHDAEAKQKAQSRLAEVQKQHAEEEQKLARLVEQDRKLEAEYKSKQERLNQLVAEQRQHVQQRLRLQAVLQVTRNQLAAKERQRDPVLDKPQLEQDRAAAVEKHYAAAQELVAMLRERWHAVRKRTALELGQREAEMQVRAVESVSQERKDKEARLTDQVAKVQRMLNSSKAALDRAKRQAQLEAPLTAEVQRRLDKLPSDSDELRFKREALEAEVAAIVCNNPRALEDYQERQKEITELRSSVDSDKAQVEGLNTEISTIKATWLPELRRVVATINTTFSVAFSDMGCVGEVVLDESSGEDYDKYCIKILVQFRESERLLALSATRHSGGERSVSTMLYLLALQGVTVTPFRVVDEINQGMDAVNEREVFSQLVRASCKEGTPQIFLLTPKLLPDLEYSPDITVLQIMNGAISGAGSGVTWGLTDLLGRRTPTLVATHG